MSLVVHVISPGMCSLWNIFTLFVFLFVCLHLQAVETCASGRIIRIYVLITELLKCNIQLYANIFKLICNRPHFAVSSSARCRAVGFGDENGASVITINCYV
jgi:hypothetical protein